MGGFRDGLRALAPYDALAEYTACLRHMHVCPLAVILEQTEQKDVISSVLLDFFLK